MVFRELDKATAPLETYGVPRFYNLYLDPKEEYPSLGIERDLWIRYPMSEILNEHKRSIQNARGNP